jgi:hypothetical protein
MKRTLAVLAGLTLAIALPAVSGAEDAARPEASKAKKPKTGVSATAKATPAVPDAESVEAEEMERTEPTHSIRVLENPYDISSFYRSEGGGGAFIVEEGASDERYPIAGFYRAEGGQGPYSIAGYYRAEGGRGQYPIAGFYRQGGGRGAYGGFWNSGYGPRHRGRTRGLVGYRRSIGENGDLFLIAPFLAPVGPLSDVFNR